MFRKLFSKVHPDSLMNSDTFSPEHVEVLEKYSASFCLLKMLQNIDTLARRDFAIEEIKVVLSQDNTLDEKELIDKLLVPLRDAFDGIEDKKQRSALYRELSQKFYLAIWISDFSAKQLDIFERHSSALWIEENSDFSAKQLDSLKQHSSALLDKLRESQFSVLERITLKMHSIKAHWLRVEFLLFSIFDTFISIIIAEWDQNQDKDQDQYKDQDVQRRVELFSNLRSVGIYETALINFIATNYSNHRLDNLTNLEQKIGIVLYKILQSLFIAGSLICWFLPLYLFAQMVQWTGLILIGAAHLLKYTGKVIVSTPLYVFRVCYECLSGRDQYRKHITNIITNRFKEASEKTKKGDQIDAFEGKTQRQHLLRLPSAFFTLYWNLVPICKLSYPFVDLHLKLYPQPFRFLVAGIINGILFLVWFIAAGVGVLLEHLSWKILALTKIPFDWITYGGFSRVLKSSILQEKIKANEQLQDFTVTLLECLNKISSALSSHPRCLSIQQTEEALSAVLRS